MTADGSRFHLFERIGVELEYMIVDAATLNVLPIADRVLGADGERAFDDDPLLAGVTWSNELAAHVIELKVCPPAESLAGIAALFARHVARLSAELRPHGACLMPTAMHPWMDPARETRLWPHDCGPIYEAFNRVFGCSGHGWVNVQSTHINLPFFDDAEFARLHAAIRLVLPILPGLAAGSPYVEGRATGIMDTRLSYYRDNCKRVPGVTGRVIPESVSSEGEYEDVILRPMYLQMAPFDAEGVLRHEWLNARGAIARFERNTIEIRLLDVQEHPAADLDIVALVVGVVRGLTEERWGAHTPQKSWPIEPLQHVLQSTIERGSDAIIKDAAYLRLFGTRGNGAMTAANLWNQLAADLGLSNPRADTGCLAQMIMNDVGAPLEREPLAAAYRRLVNQLAGCQ